MADDPQIWTEGLPEDIRSHPKLKDFPMEKTDDKGEKFPSPMASMPIDLVKSYLHQQALVGKEKIPLPGENATDEEWAEVYSRLGRPETAEGYEIKTPENLPEAMEIKPELITGYKERCHKIGILPHQAQDLLTWFLGENGKEMEARDIASGEFVKQTEAVLRKEWGKAYDEKEKSAQDAFNFFAAKLGPEGDNLIRDLMEETKLGNQPVMIKFFAQIGEMIGEDVITGKAKTGFAMTPEQAQAEIAKMHDDKAYWDAKHPEHLLKVARMKELHDMAYPEETTPIT